jgi:hypothetical protein
MRPRDTCDLRLVSEFTTVATPTVVDPVRHWLRRRQAVRLREPLGVVLHPSRRPLRSRPMTGPIPGPTVHRSTTSGQSPDIVLGGARYPNPHIGRDCRRRDGHAATGRHLHHRGIVMVTIGLLAIVIACSFYLGRRSMAATVQRNQMVLSDLWDVLTTAAAEHGRDPIYDRLPDPPVTEGVPASDDRWVGPGTGSDS